MWVGRKTIKTVLFVESAMKWEDKGRAQYINCLKITKNVSFLHRDASSKSQRITIHFYENRKQVFVNSNISELFHATLFGWFSNRNEKSRRFLDRIVQSAQEQSKKNEGGRAFKCTSFYLKQSCQAMQVVMQYYISRCNKAKKKEQRTSF